MEDHEIVDEFIGNLSEYFPDLGGVMLPDIDGGWLRSAQVEGAILIAVRKYGLVKLLDRESAT